jgi:hypothetical protein
MRLPSNARVRPIPQMQNTLQDSTAGRRSTLLTAAIILCALPAAAQLPATPPTAMAPIAATPTSAPVSNRPRHAEVSFTDGLLTVRANDSSLHQILSTIAHQTGMKITGGVADERVFGIYGPAPAGTILATLLDGTGVNMLIQESDARQPVALILTPRGGGATPPSITPQDAQIGLDDSVSAAPAIQPQTVPPQQSVQQPLPQQLVAPNGVPVTAQPANNVLGDPNNVTPTASQIPTTNSVPIDTLPRPSTTTQSAQGIVDTPNQAPAGGVPATPDQIYQQLLQLQRAKAAAAGSTTTPAPPSGNTPQ